MKKKQFYSVLLVCFLLMSFAGCASMFSSQSTPVNTSLEGVWSRNDGEIVITITGDNGVFTRINPNTHWQRVQNNGHVRIGDQKLRNITQTGNLRWTAQDLTMNDGNYTIGGWNNCIITMGANGRTIQLITEGGVVNPNNAYTRVQ